MKILVGQNVIVVLVVFKPRDDRQVGRESARDARARHSVFRPHVHNRTVIGAEKDALAVDRTIKGGQSEIVALTQLDIDFRQDRRHACHGSGLSVRRN